MQCIPVMAKPNLYILKKNSSKSAYQNDFISKGSCDTQDSSIDAENSQISKYISVSNVLFYKVNTALVSTRDFFSKMF